MYHLLVRGVGWKNSSGSLWSDRVFECTDDAIANKFMPLGRLDINEIKNIPAIFMSEIKEGGNEVAHIGYIGSVNLTDIANSKHRNVYLEYILDKQMPRLTNLDLKALSAELKIGESEFTRMHWAIKDVDLYKVMFKWQFAKKYNPQLFYLEAGVKRKNISVMMPFHPGFDAVYESLQSLAQTMDLSCERADDIWEHSIIVQDIVNLIYQSEIVICDCTGRNANVFYEAGIAHTLGREVIFIAQSKDDIPFDVTHIRCISYLNNSEGLRVLSQKIEARIKTINDQKND